MKIVESMKEISSREIKELLSQGKKNVLIVDVREKDEVKDLPLFPPETSYYKNLPLSVLRVLPREEIRARMEEFLVHAGVSSEQARIVLSCRSGGRSGQAQTLCASVGLETENLEGGYLAGRKNGIHNNWWQYVAAPQKVIL